MKFITAWPRLPAAIILLLTCTPALAGNGLRDAAIGVQSAGMAGADLALTNTTAAININPAGLSRINVSRLDLHLEPVEYQVAHRDSIGGHTDLENDNVMAFSTGYARRLNEAWVAGIGMFFIGGSGFEYEDLPNAFGPPGEVSALFGSLTLSPGVSWQVNEKLTFGAAVSIIYSSAEQTFLPQISTPEFQGFRLDQLEGISTSFRIGLLYELSPEWTLAAAYANEMPIRLEDGTMWINRSGAGQSPLIYRDVTIKGLNFSEDFSLGVAYKPTPRLTLALDLTWSEWADAMQASKLIALRPNDPAAPSELVVTTPQNWRDHLLAALGFEYQWRENTLLRAGVSYGRSPQLQEGLGPTNNVLADLTLGVGFTHRPGDRWEITAGYVWQPELSKSYTDPAFGGEARETFGARVLHLGVTRRW